VLIKIENDVYQKIQNLFRRNINEKVRAQFTTIPYIVHLHLLRIWKNNGGCGAVEKVEIASSLRSSQ
jgi:hypothetical protein